MQGVQYLYWHIPRARWLLGPQGTHQQTLGLGGLGGQAALQPTRLRQGRARGGSWSCGCFWVDSQNSLQDCRVVPTLQKLAPGHMETQRHSAGLGGRAEQRTLATVDIRMGKFLVVGM